MFRRDPWGRDRRSRRRGGSGLWSGPDYHSDVRRMTAPEAAARAAGLYVRWVARAPDTRGLANGLAALYPAGEAAHLAGANPLLLGGLSVPFGLAAWTGTYKAHGSRKYSATLTATAAGIPVWLGVAATTGIFSLPVAAAYGTAATLAWSGYTWSDVLRQRRAWRREQARWETIAVEAQLEGSRLVKAEDARLGKRFRVDVRGCAKTASELARSKLPERIAAALGIGTGSVRITLDPNHAGIIVILVRLTDPWAAPLAHPALEAPAALPAGKRRSILDGPLVLGEDPETGHDLELVIFDKAGGHHTFVVAPTGSGKTTLYGNIIEQASGRHDVLIWGIELGKGTICEIWRPVLDATAGIDEYDRALMILTWAVIVIKERSRKSAGRNHKPSPDEPVILLPVDELDTLTGANSPIAHKARPLVETIFRRGRSAGVVIVIAAQRGVIQYTGTKDPHANADNKIVLRMNRLAEMNNVIPDWDMMGLPNMVTYAPGVSGVALIVNDSNTWRAGRVRDLSGIDEDGPVCTLAHQRGGPPGTLEADIAAILRGYADRHRVPAALPTASGNVTPFPAPGRKGGNGWGIDPGDDNAVARLSQDLVAEVERRLAGMPQPPETATSLADLLAAKNALDNAEHNTPEQNRAIPVPDGIAETVLSLLSERADAGARRDEIVAALDKPTSTTARWLAIMRDHRIITATGAGKAARYYLPEHDPGATDDDDDPPGDHAE